MDKKKAPNILFIMTDQMRGDCLGIAGHPDVKTPYLDQLAASGTLFKNAYTAVPSCIAARCGLHTGLSQEHHGRVGYADGVDWNYDVTMAGELKKAGYYTQCVGKMHVHPLRNLLGFDNIELHDGYLHYYRHFDTPFYEHQTIADDYFRFIKTTLGADYDATDAGIDCNSFLARPWPYAEEIHPTNWVTNRSIDFLRRRDRSKPFFLMSSYVRPHPPFDAPACFFDMYQNKDLTMPPIGEWADAERLKQKGRYVDADTGPIDEDTMKRALVGYYACISHLDNQIGRLLCALNEDGSLQDTVIVFCSDHGELLGDHHTFRKTRPYQGSINIPMIVSNCNKSRESFGAISDNLVELRDVMATFLDVAGVNPPQSIDGISMLCDNEREFLHGEHSGGDIGNHYIVTKTDKFCWFTQSGKEQYFDLVNDPKEMHDGIADERYGDRVALLRQELIKVLVGREEGFCDGKQLFAGKKQLSNLAHV